MKISLDELVSKKHELSLESVWTIDGKLRYKRVGSERIITINCHDDVMKVTSRPRNSYDLCQDVALSVSSILSSVSGVTENGTVLV